MHKDSRWEIEPPEWREERFRYKVLRSLYEFSGASSTRIVDTSELRAGVDATLEHLADAMAFLENDGFLITVAEARRVCITAEGVDYIEKLAGRRRSIRASLPA